GVAVALSADVPADSYTLTPGTVVPPACCRFSFGRPPSVFEGIEAMNTICRPSSVHSTGPYLASRGEAIFIALASPFQSHRWTFPPEPRSDRNASRFLSGDQTGCQLLPSPRVTFSSLLVTRLTT